MSLAVLLSCHGTVDSIDDLPAFLSNIRRGRPTPPHLIEEVRRRFQAIGGSPLMVTTRAQAEGLAERTGLRVEVAGRLWHPYPKDVLARLSAEGVDTVVSVPLAPQSVHIYHAAVKEALPAGMRLIEAPAWGNHPGLIEAFVETIEEALNTLPEQHKKTATVLLTAHSLPQRVIDMGDPYERDFRSMAGLVAERVRSSGNPCQIAFQSQGATNDVWLGPDLPTAFAALAEAGSEAVVIAPIGFLSDHVETLYDLDIEARQMASSKGLHFARAAALNTRPSFLNALTDVTKEIVRSI